MLLLALSDFWVLMFCCCQVLIMQVFSLNQPLTKNFQKRVCLKKNWVEKSGLRKPGNLREKFTNPFLQLGDLWGCQQIGIVKFLYLMKDRKKQSLRSSKHIMMPGLFIK